MWGVFHVKKTSRYSVFGLVDTFFMIWGLSWVHTKLVQGKTNQFPPEDARDDVLKVSQIKLFNIVQS